MLTRFQYTTKKGVYGDLALHQTFKYPGRHRGKIVRGNPSDFRMKKIFSIINLCNKSLFVPVNFSEGNNNLGQTL